MAVKKFFKFDSEKGYLDNKDDINYYASTLMRKVAFGKMLGDFDENGLYVLNQKIIEELIKMPKVVVEIIEGADLIRSKVKADAFFHFILTIEDNKATLKLLEKIPYQSNRNFNSGSYSNINEYVLDEVIIPDKDFNRNALYEKYNISTDNDGEVLSIFDMDELSIALYYNIVEKLKIDYLVQNALILKEKELESIEADYFEAILGVFNEFKEFGDKVTASVKKDLAEKHSFVIISKPFFQQTVNEIVDSYIELHLQELSLEQQEKVLNRIREIKADYYQKFKALLPIQIAQKSGVRFDNSQTLQEAIIGSLAQEISTKGFTKSDIRKILIDEDELQLTIAKIKAMVSENEEICKRDNTKAKDITKNRELTTKFYDELEKEKKVDILKPDTSLIKSTINEKADTKVAQSDSGKAKKVDSAKSQVGGAKAASKAKSAVVKAKGGAVKSKSQTVKKASAVKKSGGKTANAAQVKVSTEQENPKASPILITGTKSSEKTDNKSSSLLEELMGDDHRIVRESSKASRGETFVHADINELTK